MNKTRLRNLGGEGLLIGSINLEYAYLTKRFVREQDPS